MALKSAQPIPDRPTLTDTTGTRVGAGVGVPVEGDGVGARVGVRVGAGVVGESVGASDGGTVGKTCAIQERHRWFVALLSRVKIAIIWNTT